MTEGLTPFTPKEMARVATAYGFNTLVSILPLLQGENNHYVCRCQDREYFIRVSRRADVSAESLLSELAWIEALSGDMVTSTVVRTRDNAPYLIMDLGEGERFIVIFEMLYGFHLTDPTEDDWYAYGALLGQLHVVSEGVLARQAPNWIGRTRPSFNIRTITGGAVDALGKTALVPCDLVTAFAAEVEPLAVAAKALEAEDGFQSFIHFDPHLGNVLLTPQARVLLDFEECCFGPRAIDLGVVRLHALSEHRLDLAWPAFTKGYGVSPATELAPLGAALKAFYLAGKIPGRMDVPDVARNPEGILRSLLDLIRQEREVVGW